MGACSPWGTYSWGSPHPDHPSPNPAPYTVCSIWPVSLFYGAMDARGIRRGRCNACEDCDGFTPQANSKSCECDHPPGRHQKLDGSGSSQAAVAHSTPSVAHHYPMCSYQGCKNNVHFDLNSQQEYTFCKDHIVHVGVPAADSDLDSDSDSEIVSNSDSDVSDNFVAHPGSKCAIEECRKPKYVDANGTEHDCCGYTHAMELARRKIIKRKYSILCGHVYMYAEYIGVMFHCQANIVHDRIEIHWGYNPPFITTCMHTYHLWARGVRGQ